MKINIFMYQHIVSWIKKKSVDLYVTIYSYILQVSKYASVSKSYVVLKKEKFSESWKKLPFFIF